MSTYYVLEKEMAIHSSTIAWKILWTEEPGRLQSMGSQRVGHNWATSLSYLLTYLLCARYFSKHALWKTHLALKQVLRDGYYYYDDITYEETEA